ncbi:MAG: hypothetical protein Q9227_006031 [Pyrenula ochraceoflavens]
MSCNIPNPTPHPPQPSARSVDKLTKLSAIQLQFHHLYAGWKAAVAKLEILIEADKPDLYQSATGEVWRHTAQVAKNLALQSMVLDELKAEGRIGEGGGNLSEEEEKRVKECLGQLEEKMSGFEEVKERMAERVRRNGG